MMHGPFLFHANAFIYFLFGVSDATARVMPALAGIGTIVVSWFFRRWIGRTGALLTALLFLFSPSILFHSRYIRNDIYIVFFSMLWVYFMFRYVEERKLKWLYYTVTVMALGFAAKENQFMSGTIFGIFMVGAAAWRWWTGQEELRGGAFGDIAVLLLTLVLPFAAPIGHLALGWDALAYRTTLDLTRSALLVVLMTGLSAAIAYWWFGPVGVGRGWRQFAGRERARGKSHLFQLGGVDGLCSGRLRSCCLRRFSLIRSMGWQPASWAVSDTGWLSRRSKGGVSRGSTTFCRACCMNLYCSISA